MIVWILDQIKALWLWHWKKQNYIVAERFIKLFESHGIHKNQIPRFFGYDLTLKDVLDTGELIRVLTPQMLSSASLLFAIRQEWLEGEGEQIYLLHDFYKYPDKFRQFLLDLLSQNPDGNLRGVLHIPNNGKDEQEALLILEEEIGQVGERRICRYHICNNWLWPYWKARAYLTACVAVAWKENVHISGRKATSAYIQKYSSGDIIPTSEMWGGEFWYPEDMALDPNIYLDKLDSETDDFGKFSALELWLSLEDDGFMNCELPYQNVRQRFENALARLQAKRSYSSAELRISPDIERILEE